MEKQDNSGHGAQIEKETENTLKTKTSNSKTKLETLKVVLKKPLTKKQRLVALVLGVLLAGGGTAWILLSSNVRNVPLQNVVNPSNVLPREEPAPEGESTIDTSNAVFFDTAKLIDNKKFLKNPEKDFGSYDDGDGEKPSLRESDIKYYQIGNTNSGQAIIYVYTEVLTGQVEYVAVETDENQFEILLKHDPYSQTAEIFEDLSQKLSDNIKINNRDVFTELQFKLNANINGAELVTSWDDTPFVTGIFLPDGINSLSERASDPKSNTLAAPHKIAADGDITYYLIEHSTPEKNSTFKVYTVEAVYKKLFSATYDIKGAITSSYDEEADIEWSTGDNNKSAYLNSGPGCGTGFIVVEVNESQLTQVGTVSGEPVYQLPTTNAFVKDIYKNDYDSGGEWIKEKDLKNLSIEEFSDKHGYILYKNKLGQYEAYVRSDMITRGGCGKPVVYLYPEQTTSVSVSVGADITKSEPLYPVDGWRNVIAQPSGQLLYSGKNYPYLFWEGYGNGGYPSVSSGVVVKSSKAISTIRSQLTAQGLNKQESDDFVEFWKTKLPTDRPYIRLTWLSKKQIDELAPLRVSPTPQTVIRVFLEFEGLDKPESLQPQHFAEPVRQGFTVVEWGGLLTDGSERN